MDSAARIRPWRFHPRHAVGDPREYSPTTACRRPAMHPSAVKSRYGACPLHDSCGAQTGDITGEAADQGVGVMMSLDDAARVMSSMPSALQEHWRAWPNEKRMDQIPSQVA